MQRIIYDVLKNKMTLFKMKKIIFLVATIVATVFNISAQSMYGDQYKADIKMNYLYSFEEALAKSKKEGKPIFFNCFADWYVPCHLMNQAVFSDQEFADWMNKHFVNLFIDVSKSAGRPLAQKYDIKFFAHYLVLDSDGNVIHRIVGGYRLPEFKQLLEKSLNPKSSFAGIKARYDSGDRKMKFLREAYEVFGVADEGDLKKEVSDKIFSMLKEKEWSKSENWTYFSNKARTSVDNEYFKYLIGHKGDFLKENDKEKVDKFLSNGYFKVLMPYATGHTAYNANKILEIFIDLQKCDLPQGDDVFTLYRIAKARGEKRYADMIHTMEQETGEWKSNITSMLDTSFGDLQGLPVEEKEIIVDYLKQVSAKMTGSGATPYLNAIRSLTNADGVAFEKLSFAEALQKAEREGKLVFMDCYTTWCGPCQRMNVQIFPLKSVGDIFNKHFVSIKVDMEKGEGPELGKRYGVKAFPTMFILDSKGEVVHTMVGGRGEKALLEEVEKIVN